MVASFGDILCLDSALSVRVTLSGLAEDVSMISAINASRGLFARRGVRSNRFAVGGVTVRVTRA